jgi:hypothetical protein
MAREACLTCGSQNSTSSTSPIPAISPVLQNEHGDADANAHRQCQVRRFSPSEYM